MRLLRRALDRFGVGRAVALVILAYLVLLRIWDPLPIEAIRLRGFDLFQLVQPRTPQLKPVVIVDLDEASLREVGQWPWPRTLVAEMVGRLTAAGAVAIGFDVIFPERDRTSARQTAETIPGLDPETRAKLKALPSNDEVLAEAISRSRVILGQTALAQPSRAPEEPLPQTGFAVKGPRAEPPLLSFAGLLRNVPELERAAAGRGLFTIRTERDGVVRRVPIVLRAEDIIVPSLTLEMLRVVSKADGILINTDEAGVRSVALPGFEIPTDPWAQLWIHFSPHDPSRYVSAADLLLGRAALSRFRGKLVLIGTSAVGLLDLKTTPIDPAMPGVEIHAQILESVLSRTILAAPGYATLAEILISALIALALIGLAPALSAWGLFLAGGAIAAAVLGLSWYYFSQLNLLIDYTFPLLSSLVVYWTLVFTNYLRAHNERQQIRSAFSQYLSPALVEELARSPEKLALGGEQRTLTVLFSDVRGFTSISELYRDDPAGLTRLMNRLLTPLTHAVIDRKGTMDKYMGDAIMAFWNAPLEVPGHELLACEAALVMQERMAELNAARQREAAELGQPFLPMVVGVGLNTGTCVVGNMGSDLFFNYSVLGDPVNLASRLEGQSKVYGVPIVIGASTAAFVGDRFATLELDCVRVKGKSEPERISALLGRDDLARSVRFCEMKERNAAMLAAYRERNWAGALEALMLCREAGSGFGLAAFYELYLERIRTLMHSPPPPEWNGVWAAERK